MGRRKMQVAGPLAPYVDGLKADLVGRGYGSQSVSELVWLMAHVSRWLADRGLDGDGLTAIRAEQFLRARREEGRRRRVSTGGMAPLLDFLRRIGVAPPPEPIGGSGPVDSLIGRYEFYLVQERGLSSASLPQYLDDARTFLVAWGFTGDADLKSLSVTDVVDYLRSRCGRFSAGYAKSMAVRLRSLLRFLHVRGLIPNALAAAVPSVASWRLTELPTGVGATDVARLLNSCDRDRPTGRRDYAVILLLTRLGLRAGEVAVLRLTDINWRTGELTIHGKGNREDTLPLPHDVGEAIAAWLLRGRPRGVCSTVFTRVLPPLGPLSGSAVSALVRQACRRCGVPPVGAHRLRHFAATRMLRAGGSLAEVGQVLRHRSPAVTAIYTKVDRVALSAVVQPWPGGAA